MNDKDFEALQVKIPAWHTCNRQLASLVKQSLSLVLLDLNFFETVSSFPIYFGIRIFYNKRDRRLAILIENKA